jgi:hypothetical protein
MAKHALFWRLSVWPDIISVNQPPASHNSSTVPDCLSTLALERCLALALVKLAALAR